MFFRFNTMGDWQTLEQLKSIVKLYEDGKSGCIDFHRFLDFVMSRDKPLSCCHSATKLIHPGDLKKLGHQVEHAILEFLEKCCSCLQRLNLLYNSQRVFLSSKKAFGWIAGYQKSHLDFGLLRQFFHSINLDPYDSQLMSILRVLNSMRDLNSSIGYEEFRNIISLLLENHSPLTYHTELRERSLNKTNIQRISDFCSHTYNQESVKSKRKNLQEINQDQDTHSFSRSFIIPGENSTSKAEKKPPQLAYQHLNTSHSNGLFELDIPSCHVKSSYIELLSPSTGKLTENLVDSENKHFESQKSEIECLGFLISANERNSFNKENHIRNIYPIIEPRTKGFYRASIGNSNFAPENYTSSISPPVH